MSKKTKTNASPLPWSIRDNMGVISLKDASGQTIATFAGTPALREANAKFILDSIEATATIASVIG